MSRLPIALALLLCAHAIAAQTCPPIPPGSQITYSTPPCERMTSPAFLHLCAPDQPITFSAGSGYDASCMTFTWRIWRNHTTPPMHTVTISGNKTFTTSLPLGTYAVNVDISNPTQGPYPYVYGRDGITVGYGAFVGHNFNFSESQDQGAIYVQRTSGIGTATVDYAVTAGPGAGQRYEASSGTLTFEPGELIKPFFIDIHDDTIAQGPELMSYQLSNPTGGYAFHNENETITMVGVIRDNDNDDPLDLHIVLDPSSTLLRTGGEQPVAVRLEPGSFSTRTITFSSSNPAVASVTPNVSLAPGGVSYVAVQALGTGTATITATHSSSTTTLNVEVLPRVSASSLSPTAGPSTGGTLVEIRGSGFAADCEVNFGGYAAETMAMADDFIVVRTPRQNGGRVDVAIACGSSVEVLPGAFTYSDRRRSARK